MPNVKRQWRVSKGCLVALILAVSVGFILLMLALASTRVRESTPAVTPNSAARSQGTPSDTGTDLSGLDVGEQPVETRGGRPS